MVVHGSWFTPKGLIPDLKLSEEKDSLRIGKTKRD
jgi:hypothetical protein